MSPEEQLAVDAIVANLKRNHLALEVRRIMIERPSLGYDRALVLARATIEAEKAGPK